MTNEIKSPPFVSGLHDTYLLPPKILNLRQGTMVRSPSRILADELQQNLTSPLKQSIKSFEEEMQKDLTMSDPARKKVLIKILKGSADSMLNFVNHFMDKSRELHSSREQKTGQMGPIKFSSSDLVHELRSPLNNIIGCLTNLECADDPAEYLEILKISYNHLNGIVKNINAQGASLKLKKENFALSHLVESVKGLTSQIKPSVPIQFVLKNVTNENVLLRGDETKLNQVLVNLISNALKFSPDHGKIEVAIEVLEDRKNEMVFRFGVQDEGSGISEEKQTKLFKRFSQLDQPERDYTASSGAGLYVSLNLVQLMHGHEILIDSHPETGEKGTRFYFDLPIEKASVGPVQICSLKKTRSNSLIPEPGYEILVADDNKITRRLLEQQYKKYSGDDVFSVNIVNNGDEAVKEFQNQYYHVVILDMQMAHEKDGWETARKLFEMAEANEMQFPKVIIYSGSDVEGLKNEAVKSGSSVGQALSQVEFFPKGESLNNLAEKTFKLGREMLSRPLCFSSAFGCRQ